MSDRLATEAEGRILSQYADSGNLRDTIKGTVAILQSIDDSETRCASFADIDTATGGWLDLIGNARNVRRYIGESDSAYRARIVVEGLNKKAGTPDYVIAKAAVLSGDPAPVFFDEEAALSVAFVYTPNGRQLSRKEVDALVPAGVIGVPGSKIVTATGKTVNAGSRNEYMLISPSNERLTDSEGNELTGVIGFARKIIAVAKNSAIEQ